MILRQTLNTLSEGILSTASDQEATLIDVWLGIVRNDVATQWVAEPLEKWVFFSNCFQPKKT